MNTLERYKEILTNMDVIRRIPFQRPCGGPCKGLHQVLTATTFYELRWAVEELIADIGSAEGFYGIRERIEAEARAERSGKL